MDYLPENDGIDHINIFSRGKTELGRWLTNFAYSPIDIPEDGKFLSVEGYWYWLKSKDNRLKKLYGFQAKKIGRDILDERQLSEEVSSLDFKFIYQIKKAIDIKLKSNKKILMEFAKSDLPFTHYYVFNGNKREAGFEWIVEHFEDRRKLLKEHFKI